MSKSSDQDHDKVQAELRAQQPFTMAGAIGRAGSGLLKGASPISRQQQAAIQLTQWLDQQALDPSAALKSILGRRIRDEQRLLERHLQQPANALREIIETILASEYKLEEFVRQIDVRWGELYQQRPLFQQAGQQPDPADEYSHASVREDLLLLLEKLRLASNQNDQRP